MIVTIDFETSKAPRHLPWFCGYIVSLAAVLPETGEVKFWLLNHKSLEDGDETILAPSQGETVADIHRFFEALSSHDTVVAHNAKFELHWLYQLGIDCQNFRVYCTQIAEYVLNGQSRGNSLHATSRRYGQIGKSDRVSQYWESDYETDEIPVSVLRSYNIQDCWQTYYVFCCQQKRATPEVRRLLEQEFETVRHLTTIERNGMVVDGRKLKVFADEYEQRLAAIDGRLRSIFGTDANFSSPEQVSYCLYGRSEKVLRKQGVQAKHRCEATDVQLNINWPTVGLWNPIELKLQEKKKIGVYCTDKATISQLPVGKRDSIKKEVKELLIERADVKKQLTTYFNGLQEHAVNGVIHPSMNQCFTVTGRLSSSKPNLQNITRGSTSPVKQCFVSRYDAA